MPLYADSRRPRALGLVAAWLAFGGAPTFVEAQATLDQAQFGDWTLQCTDEASDVLTCWLFQRLVNQDDNTQLADIRIGIARNDDVGSRVLLMHAPTGILLTARAAFRVDEDETDVAMNWHNCTERRCTAVRQLVPAEFDKLLAGGKMVIGYQRLQAPQPTAFEVPLIGVTSGFEALKARMEAK